MKTLAASGLALGAYLAMSDLLYGDVLSPIWLATAWSAHLGLPFWRGAAVIATSLSAWLSFHVLNRYVPAILRPSLFVASALASSTLTIGLWADWTRHRSIIASSSSRVEEHSFFKSIREAPRTPQFFLHAAVLKGCTAYAWSYRELAFYELKPSVSANVLPADWLKTCPPLREDR